MDADIYLPEHKPRRITWGVAMANVKTGFSELLLDNRPFVWCGDEVKVGNRIIRKVRLPRGIRLTEKAIDSLLEACREFPGVQEVSNFGGWLKDTNLTIFKHEYLKLKRKGVLEEDRILLQALLETPFGKARNSMGISEFEICVMEHCHKGNPKAVLVKSARYPASKRAELYAKEVSSAQRLENT